MNKDALPMHLEYIPRPNFKMPKAGKYPELLEGFKKLSRGKQKQLLAIWKQRKANEARIEQWKEAKNSQRARTLDLAAKFKAYRPNDKKRRQNDN